MISDEHFLYHRKNTEDKCPPFRLNQETAILSARKKLRCTNQESHEELVRPQNQKIGKEKQ